MRPFIILFVVNSLVFLFLEYVLIGHDKDNIEGVELFWSIPETKGTLSGKFEKKIFVYYKGHDVLIREPYTSVTYNNKAIKDNVFLITDDSITIDHQEKKYIDFVYTEKFNKGLKYDSKKSERFSVFNVDSLIKIKTFNSLNLFDISNDSLINTKKNINGTILKVFIPKVKYDLSYNDTTYFLFDTRGMQKKNHYSISKKADSFFKMSLVEVKLIYNPITNQSNPLFNTPKKELLFRINKLKVANKEEIEKIFIRFREDKKRYLN